SNSAHDKHQFVVALAHRAQQLAADVFLAGLAIAHHALAGADDGDAQAVEDIGTLLDLAVHAPARLALAVQLVDHLVAGERVLELPANLPLLGVIDNVVLFDVPLILQHPRDARADLALGDKDHLPADPVCIPDSGQHVRDGIL